MDDLLNCTDPRRQPTFSRRNRARRALWGLIYLLLFRPSPRQMHSWRSILLRLFGATVGKGCHIYPKVVIWAPWNLVVESQASAADGVNLYSMARITIGRRAVISQGAHICTGSHDYTDPSFCLYAKPITIGAESWICADAFLGPGVTIGEGAVIGARSVVIRDMPNWTVCAGHPCTPIKPRSLTHFRGPQL